MDIRTMDLKEEELSHISRKIEEFIHSDIKQAHHYALELLNSSEENENEGFIALALNKIGYCNYMLRDLNEALRYFKLARASYTKLNDLSAVIGCLNSMGVIYRQNGNYSQALKLYFEALKINEKQQHSNPAIYNNIATIYFKQGALKKALTYFSKSLKIREQNKVTQPKELTYVLTNIANIHFEIGDFLQSEKIYRRVIKIGKTAHSPILYIPSVKGLSKILLKRGDTLDAYELLKEGIELSEAANYQIEKIHLSLEMSHILKSLGKYEERKELLQESLSIAIDHQKDLIFNCLEALLEHYEDVEDYKNSFKVLRQMNTIREKRYKNEKAQRLTELQTMFESREKDKLLEQEKIFTQELETRNQKLIALNQDLEQFNYAVSHDLKEPIRSVKAYSKLLLTHAENKMDEHELDAVNKMEQSIKRMEQMIDDLLQFAILGNKEKKQVPVDLNEVIEIVKADLQIKIKENQATISCDNLPTIVAHKSLMVQLFQNLISNAIKFRRKSVPPVVSITSKTIGKMYHISVQDNGMGIPEKQLKNVFKLFKRLDKASNIEGSGIGLSLCQKIITKMQGHIDLASTLDSGTTFQIKLPKD